MASWSGNENTNVLVLDSNALQRSCPQQALQPTEFPRFLVLSTPLRGMELKLKSHKSKATWILGSGFGADFTIADSTLHASHLYIEFVSGDWFVTCHPDCWGFHVNGEPVETAVVEHGDRLRVGRHELIFVGAQPVSALEESRDQGRGWLRWFKRAS